GSAVLSAETALELLDEDKRSHVHLYPGPVVEQAVAAASLAAAGAGVEEILKGRAGATTEGPVEGAEVSLHDPPGLHARPAAQLVRLARRHEATVTLKNLTTNTGPADTAGIHAILALNARHGHRLLIEARGPDAAHAVAELVRTLVHDQP